MKVIVILSDLYRSGKKRRIVKRDSALFNSKGGCDSCEFGNLLKRFNLFLMRC
jgi:hypothetical protein